MPSFETEIVVPTHNNDLQSTTSWFIYVQGLCRYRSAPDVWCVGLQSVIWVHRSAVCYIAMQNEVCMQSVIWVHRSTVWYTAVQYEVCSLLSGYIGLQSGTLLCNMKSAVCYLGT